MPTSGVEAWWCEHFVFGPWAFFLLGLPLAGAYFYGIRKQKLGWILIGLWISMQIPISYINYVKVTCVEDAPLSAEPPPQDEPAKP